MSAGSCIPGGSWHSIHFAASIKVFGSVLTPAMVAVIQIRTGSRIPGGILHSMHLAASIRVFGSVVIDPASANWLIRMGQCIPPGTHSNKHFACSINTAGSVVVICYGVATVKIARQTVIGSVSELLRTRMDIGVLAGM